MKRLHTPFEGFAASSELYFGFTGEVDPGIGEMVTISAPFAALESLTLDETGGLSSAARVASLHNPQLPLGGSRFSAASRAYYATSQVMDTSTVFFRGWSGAVWFDLSSSATTGEQCLLEVTSLATTGVYPASLVYTPASSQFALRWANNRSASPPSGLPLRGMLSWDSRLEGTITDWFFDGKYVSSSTTVGYASFLSGATLAVVVGASRQAGPLGTATKHFDGVLGAGAIWTKPMGRAGHLYQYGACVRPWDESVLLENDAYHVVDRVVLVDEQVDLSTFDGQNWVVSTRITRSVDQPADKATVVLARRRGALADLSPVGYEDLLRLRRRVRIDRAFVPQDYVLQGWEYKPVFEGYIDAFDVDEDRVTVNLVDRSVALSDAFVLDPRAYNFADLPNKAIEPVLQEIIDDFEPRLVVGGSTTAAASIIGYKGYPPDGTRALPPIVHTRGGNTVLPTRFPSGSVFRYNDVPSGPVLGALTAVVDQIAGTLRYRWYEEGVEDRLEVQAPRRGKGIGLRSFIRGDDPMTVSVSTNEPHRLVLGSSVTVTGTASHNFSGTVATVSGARRFGVAYTGATIAGGSVTTATLTMNYTRLVGPGKILEVESIRSQMGAIRNHAVVKHSRTGRPFSTSSISGFSTDGAKLVTIDFSTDLPLLDPDNSGISFTIENATGGSAVLNGTYTGNQTGRRTVTSDVPATTAAASSSYSTASGQFSSDQYRYRMAVSTATASVQEFGLLPIGMYEGTGLSINTDGEAAALAAALTSDLAYPTADFAIQVKSFGYEIEDVLRLPADPKGRWGPGSLDTAVVAVEESSAAGSCYTTLELRAQAPSGGVAWAGRIAVGPTRPSGLENYPVRRDAADWALNDAVKRGRSFNLQRRNVDRREMGRRHDSTWIWLGDTADFAPTPDKLAGRFRSDNAEVTHLGSGSAIVPGTRYYVKTADQDIWGNLGQINGVGAASASTVPSFVARFLDETAGVFAVGVTGATYYAADDTWAVIDDVTVKDGSDSAGLSFDTFNNYSTASLAFRAPCDGTVMCTHRSTWIGGPLKVGVSTPWDVFGRFVHSRNGVVLGVYGTDGISGIGNTAFEDMSLTASITCSSGDWIRVEARATLTTDAFTANTSTSTTSYTATSFALVGQR